MKAASKLKLSGKSRKGKNRVREHGPDWMVMFVRPKVFCLGNVPGAFIKAARTDETRWIRLHDDPDFSVEIN